MSLVGLALAFAVLGLVTLSFLPMTGACEWRDALPLLGVVTAAAALLALPLLPLRRPPAAAPPPDGRASSTTTLFGLQQTLQALAAPASIQLTMFPDLVANGQLVMGEFQQWRERAMLRQEMLTPQQREALLGLDQCLQSMLATVALWNGEAVRSAPEWSQLRATARRTLVAFSWSVDMPIGLVKRRRESASSVDLRPPTDQRARGSETLPRSQSQ
jgi:hypothetical protein